MMRSEEGTAPSERSRERQNDDASTAFFLTHETPCKQFAGKLILDFFGD